MKKFLASLLFLSIALISSAQSARNTINEKYVERVETVLSADSMQGRKAFTPGIEKAADFISEEFKKIKLQPLIGSATYKQTFSIISPRRIQYFCFFRMPIT